MDIFRAEITWFEGKSFSEKSLFGLLVSIHPASRFIYLIICITTTPYIAWLLASFHLWNQVRVCLLLSPSKIHTDICALFLWILHTELSCVIIIIYLLDLNFFSCEFIRQLIMYARNLNMCLNQSTNACMPNQSI